MSDNKGIHRRRRLIVGTKDNAFFIIFIGERLSSNFRTSRRLDTKLVTHTARYKFF